MTKSDCTPIVCGYVSYSLGVETLSYLWNKTVCGYHRGILGYLVVLVVCGGAGMYSFNLSEDIH